VQFQLHHTRHECVGTASRPNGMPRPGIPQQPWHNGWPERLGLTGAALNSKADDFARPKVLNASLGFIGGRLEVARKPPAPILPELQKMYDQGIVKGVEQGFARGTQKESRRHMGRGWPAILPRIIDRPTPDSRPAGGYGRAAVFPSRLTQLPRCSHARAALSQSQS